MDWGSGSGGSLSRSLCGSSVRGTCRGNFTGDPEGYEEEGSGDGHLSS